MLVTQGLVFVGSEFVDGYCNTSNGSSIVSNVGNFVYQGQLLEKRDNNILEALGVGYFF